MTGGIRRLPTLLPAEQCYQHTVQQSAGRTVLPTHSTAINYLNLPVCDVRSRVPPPQMNFCTQFLRTAAA